jgi:hypothetical protein
MKQAYLIFLALFAGGSALGQSEPKLKPDFSNVANIAKAKKLLKLSLADFEALKKNLFVVTPSDEIQLYEIYGKNDYTEFSSLVTTDNVLQLYHVFFDSTLRHVEEHHLLSELKKLSSTMVAQSRKRYLAVRQTKLASAALKNIAYFGVADRLLGGKSSLPQDAATMVAQELSSIRATHGVKASAIFPYPIDYTQFIVRGHYSRSEKLGQFFRVMMWFGLVPLALERKGPYDMEPNPEQTRQAALMVQDLFDGGALDAWQRIYDVTSLYVGDSNDLTPYQWKKAAAPVLGWPQKLGLLNDDNRLAELVAAIKKAAHPQIVDKARNASNVGAVQFRFMGQRSIPDSIIFNRLTGDKRPWPSPLDVAAAFGSQRAAQILDADPAEYNPKGWSEYGPERSAIAAEIAAWNQADWTKNLYNGCLDLIRLNLQKPSSKGPRFMQSTAWADKSISSSLAFWADLRHDTVLYGTQTNAEMGDGDEQKLLRSYVEPNSALYDRLLALLIQTQKGLAAFKYLNESETEHFKSFEDLVRFLSSVSKRELNGGKLSKDEYWKIRKIDEDLSYNTIYIQLAGESYNTLSEDDWDMALVADVHSSRGEALTVGSGHADDLLAIVPIEGKLYLARGSVLSFYEFKVPTDKRMTDHQWKKLLEAHHAPLRPSWINSYFVNASSRGKEK